MRNSCRILDLTDESGFLTGKILADLGADVIKVERPGGDPGRNIGPFIHDQISPEKSLYWLAYNSGKKSITLNLETSQGRHLFRKLVKNTDIVIESLPPGRSEELGLSYVELSAIKPSLIVTSITPFGSTGPFSHYKASDLILMGMAGLMYLTGDRDRPPVRVGLPQACLHAGADAAIGTLLAYYWREVTGQGQQVGVSSQASLVMTTLNAVPSWFMNRELMERQGTFRTISSGLLMPQIWRCKDGFVTFIVMGGATGARSMKALSKWMDEEGMGNAYLTEVSWSALDFSKLTTEMVDNVVEPIRKFFELHTKDELFSGALERGVMLNPVSTLKEITENPQLKSRDFWSEVKDAGIGDKFLCCKLPFQISGKAPYSAGRAPLVGEHNKQVYSDELGLSEEELLNLRRSNIL